MHMIATPWRVYKDAPNAQHLRVHRSAKYWRRAQNAQRWRVPQIAQTARAQNCTRMARAQACPIAERRRLHTNHGARAEQAGAQQQEMLTLTRARWSEPPPAASDNRLLTSEAARLAPASTGSTHGLLRITARVRCVRALGTTPELVGLVTEQVNGGRRADHSLQP